jgi:glycine/D-amino acid oxidase-like deaminating enzyme
LLLDEEYIKIRKIAGYRIDLYSIKKQEMILYKDVGISTPKVDGIRAVGATHKRDLNSIQETVEFFKNDNSLLIGAKKLLDDSSAKEVGRFYGIRSGSMDYFPIVGNLVDSKKTLLKYPYIKTGARVPIGLYEIYEDIYINTAFGARGFVIAPYTSKILSEFLIKDKKIDEKLLPHRLFQKHSRGKKGYK